jgi:hypothetical protein
MSLLTWLGSDKKVSPRSLSPILKKTETKRTVLGVLGTRSNVRSEDLDREVLEPLTALWSLPDELVLPAEGDSSQALQAWAALHDIPVRLLASDWVTQGRRAGMLRDAKIQREATHFLLLQGPRSNALTALASKLERKGRPVLISERPCQPVKSPCDLIKSPSTK